MARIEFPEAGKTEKGIRIESDGTPLGTKVIDLNTGKALPNSSISGISIFIEPGDIVRAEVRVIPSEVCVETDADIIEKKEDAKSKPQLRWTDRPPGYRFWLR